MALVERSEFDEAAGKFLDTLYEEPAKAKHVAPDVLQLNRALGVA